MQVRLLLPPFPGLDRCFKKRKFCLFRIWFLRKTKLDKKRVFEEKEKQLSTLNEFDQELRGEHLTHLITALSYATTFF